MTAVLQTKADNIQLSCMNQMTDNKIASHWLTQGTDYDVFVTDLVTPFHF